MQRYMYSAAGQVVRSKMDCPALDEDDFARRTVSLTGPCAVAIYTFGAATNGSLAWEQLQSGHLCFASADAALAGDYCELDVHRAMHAVRRHYPQIATLAWQLDKLPNAS